MAEPSGRPTGWWLGRNHGNRAPNAYVILDVEAHRRREGNAERQTFRLAVASLVQRATSESPWEEAETVRFTTPRALWDWVQRWRRNYRKVVVVAHNMAYDLRVSDALRELGALGWESSPPMMDRNRAIFRFRRADRSLLLIDSMGWLPESLDKVALRVGRSKVALPEEGDSEEDWWARCEGDVELLRDAWMRLVRWVERDNLGVWKPTAAGQALAAFRHRFMDFRILVHNDDEARAVEREAGWCGRCEAWRHGALPGGPWAEWDWELAYARIMADCSVPTILLDHHDKPRGLPRMPRGGTRTVLARVRVTTELPLVPARGERGILWPVGTFETVLWQPELDLLAAHGATVEPLEVWTYQARPVLRRFAQWVMPLARAESDDGDQVVALAAKHMSRALVGKFGGRYRDWVAAGEVADETIQLWRVVDARQPEAGDMLQVGRQVFRQGPEADAEQSAPQIMGWIQSEMRRRLWGAMTTAGLEHVVYVDTDGMLVDLDGSDRLAAARIPGLRVKEVHQRLEILGPRQMVVRGLLKAAGVPRGARPHPEGGWVAERWTELTTSLRHGELDSVVVRPTRYQLRGTDNRRLHLDGGYTAAVRLSPAL